MKKLWKTIRWLHKWPSLVFSLFFIFWALSGIVLNHRETFSRFEVGRSWLSDDYHFRNWNNAAVKGILDINSETSLIYGDIGIWAQHAGGFEYQSFNEGFPDGIDNRKTHCMIFTSGQTLYAGTRTGLYRRLNGDEATWEKVFLEMDEPVVGLCETSTGILCMTRSHLYRIGQDGKAVQITVKAPVDFDGNVSLFRTLWVIHSGELYGLAGKLLIDLVGLTFIFLSLTGLVYFFFPKWIKNRKRQRRETSQLVGIMRFSVKWHNKIGIWMVVLMLITATTGMFLRPPLLIPIAGTMVNPIPGTLLDQANPWHDTFRGMAYNHHTGQIAIGTVEGIYLVDDNFIQTPIKPAIQPPISVMGINEFRYLGEGALLVGSFSGLYVWLPEKKATVDYFSGMPVMGGNSLSRPVSANMVTAFYRDDEGLPYYFDYNAGAVQVGHNRAFPAMPEIILENSPMSLWNFALEVHTARIFKVVFGDFYILLIPLFGLFSVFILLTGTILWIKKFSKRLDNKQVNKYI